VSGDDFLLLGNLFNTASTAFDFNNDNTVDGSDVLNFGNRFGTAL
jgi:hypothetical protein